MPVIAAVKGSQNGFEVRRIYCVGRNYLDHIREMKEADERDPPFFFQKPTDSLVADGATVDYPAATKDFQFEVELVVAVGKAGRNIAVDAAAKHIFGYAIGIDFTRRDLQREARDRAWPWEMGKSFDQSAPCGPIHPIAGTGEITGGAISLSVNGVQKQKGDIGQMIWNVAEIIANLSKQYRLEPGDLIYTGTPAGVGPVVPGDKIECVIDGLGALRIAVGPAAA
ncbi:MAG: fumarylacetoacetate hydrolase family protein [Xanthobacteraceae bacterium]|uniref:fumarylacetoacetate hydrolase family protein n=1 Tax=Pseudolabrys sp. TaxID=1960880 RepID=UPI003D0ECB4E